ncbi:hypothetical protein AB6A40_005368 [Gnathostoma spinigerum]|uniref:Globin domain-containing protein n=1 Tax=Gnathostoma spinigerum TaxID=75299 RepID=A0ABD6EF91_9BILA
MTTRDVLSTSLDQLKLDDVQIGVDFYKHLLTTRPEIRRYFKGYENAIADDIEKSDLFKKQGPILISAVHEMIDKADNPDELKAFAESILDRHMKREIHLEPHLWTEFWPVFTEFMKTKVIMDEATEKIWIDTGRSFASLILQHLKAVLQASLENLKPDDSDAGAEFYAFFLTSLPEVRQYFKGFETATADEIKNSEFFKRQGQILVSSIHEMVQRADSPDEFETFAGQILDRHMKRKIHINPPLWSAFWPVFVEFLKTRKQIDETAENAWIEIGTHMTLAALKHVKALLTESLKNLKADDAQAGADFYKHLLTVRPHLRHYFKGFEKATPEEIAASEFFKKQGQVLLAAVHEMVEKPKTAAELITFADSILDRHLKKNIYLESHLWKDFWQVFVEFLKTKSELSEEAECAWLEIGTHFSSAILNRLKSLLIASLSSLPTDDPQVGIDFYKRLLKDRPEAKKYFKGYENASDDDIQNSEFFKKQGQLLLTSIHQLAEKADNADDFEMFTKDLLDRHIGHGIFLETRLWTEFWIVFVDFLRTKGEVSDVTSNAWFAVGRFLRAAAFDRLRNLLVASLTEIKTDDLQTGVEFYKHLLTARPDVRQYFKGYENASAEDVQNSDFFKKQGQVLIAAMHEMAEKSACPGQISAFAADIIDRHLKKDVHLDPKLWMEFWPVFVDFLKSRSNVSEAVAQAWIEVGTTFAAACVEHLKSVGEPC